MAKDRIIVPSSRFASPPRGRRIRDAITESLQHGDVKPETATSAGCSIQRVSTRVKHGVAPLFLEFRGGGPSVLLCTPDREAVRIPATNLTSVREIYSSIQACVGEKGTAARLGKCVLRTAREYGIRPVGKKRVLDGLRQPEKGRKRKVRR